MKHTDITGKQISDLIHRLFQEDVTANNITKALEGHNTDLDGLSLLLATLVELNRGNLRPLYCDSGAGKSLTRGIVEAFIEGIARFPKQYTSELRCACLYFLSKLVPYHVDYYGSDLEVHTACAFLVAKVLDITTTDLQAALEGASKIKELDQDSLSNVESLKEKSKLKKKVWFYVGDMYVHAVVFLATYPDVGGIVTAYGGCDFEFPPVTFAKASQEAYSEGRGWKFLKISVQELPAAHLGEDSERLKVCVRISRQLKIAAWSSLKASDLSVDAPMTLAEGSKDDKMRCILWLLGVAGIVCGWLFVALFVAGKA